MDIVRLLQWCPGRHVMPVAFTYARRSDLGNGGQSADGIFGLGLKMRFTILGTEALSFKARPGASGKSRMMRSTSQDT